MWLAILVIVIQGGMLWGIQAYRDMLAIAKAENRRLLDEVHMWRATFLLESPPSEEDWYV